ncbi:MAG: MarR family transcriptional regulator [Dinghuibacter sp.]|nr:MarR family transcriptional regulator [Dinghuibacter sp.]
METLSEVLFYTLEKTSKAYRKFAQAQIIKNGYDITIDQWLVLKTLQENQNIAQNQLAELVFKDFASITRIIELLTQKGFVQRKINTTDRRKFVLEITKKGYKTIENIYPIVVEYRKQALNNLTKGEINNLKAQLEKIILNCK